MTATFTPRQEGGRRAGTENVLLITALGAAARVVTDEAAELAAHMAAMLALDVKIILTPPCIFH